MGVALTSCTVPAVGKPTFEISENEIEMGIGIHGEPGRKRVALTSADSIAKEMTGAILDDLKPARGSQVLLFINGFGGTPSMELYLMYNSVTKILGEQGVTIGRSLVGNYVTSLDMNGCSITMTSLDKEILGYWDAAVLTPSLHW
jgi:dihydroxyacetone kinase-like protein